MRLEAAVEIEKAHIILVDDDPLFRESLEQNLRDHGFLVTAFGDGDSVARFIASGRGADADLILLDWKMPGMNGIEVLHHLRARGCSLPVIFLTVLSDQIYEEAALAGGAVDFVEKSRSFSILNRRIELIVDGMKTAGAPEPGAADSFVLGDLDLDLHSNRARWREHELNLTLTEFRIVHLLASRMGADVRYREIYDVVHGPGFQAGVGENGYRSNVRTFIKRIRQKFRAWDDNFEGIENYPGFGYRWRQPGGNGAAP
tara:strand:+ start:42 stop:815 length:774 start_codon:yes stop_codon:yes gene_type:complete